MELFGTACRTYAFVCTLMSLFPWIAMWISSCNCEILFLFVFLFKNGLGFLANITQTHFDSAFTIIYIIQASCNMVQTFTVSKTKLSQNGRTQSVLTVGIGLWPTPEGNLTHLGCIQYAFFLLLETNLKSTYKLSSNGFNEFPISCWRWLGNSLIMEMKYAELLLMSDGERKKSLSGPKMLQKNLLR